jgi:hypothetical protein
MHWWGISFSTPDIVGLGLLFLYPIRAVLIDQVAQGVPPFELE